MLKIENNTEMINKWNSMSKRYKYLQKHQLLLNSNHLIIYTHIQNIQVANPATSLIFHKYFYQLHTLLTVCQPLKVQFVNHLTLVLAHQPWLSHLTTLRLIKTAHLLFLVFPELEYSLSFCKVIRANVLQHIIHFIRVWAISIWYLYNILQPLQCR